MHGKVGTGGAAKTTILLLTAIAAAAALTVFFMRPSVPSPATQPATAPASQPATSPATLPAAPPVANWIDVVRRNDQRVATTQALTFPLSLNEAARLTIEDPLYLCPRGDLWITRADAPPTSAALKTAHSDQIHLVRDRVRFVLWHINDAGGVTPNLVVHDPRQDCLVRVTHSQRAVSALWRNYDWARAFAWNDRIVAPTDDGVSIIDLLNDREDFQPLGKGYIRVLLDRRGVLAWRVDGGAARFLEDRWQTLGDGQGWPKQIVELLPLLDGTVIQLVRAGEPAREVHNATPGESTITPTLLLRPGTELQSMVLDSTEVDAEVITRLVTQLSADEAAQRESAMAELSRYGPSIWPVLEKLRATQPAEAQLRLEELLSARSDPRLGVMRPIEDDLRPIAYLPDGGVVLYSDSGVEIPRGGGEARVLAPAWLAIRPGRSVKLLPAALVEDALPDRIRLSAWAEEWIASDDITGAQRFLGNHLSPLLPAEMKEFSHFAGIDSRGRWLLRKRDGDSPTIVIDPFIPDPTPRLPVWPLVVDGGIVGWDEKDWPVQKLGGAWALREEKWEPLPEDAAVKTSITQGPATAPADLLLLEEPDGTKWYDGSTNLRRVRGEERLDWEIPPEAQGTMPPTLLRAGESRLFLFNSPGRVVRIRENDSPESPLLVEATFTEDIPFSDEPQRIWLDPAGRIVIAYQGNKLAILFPGGRVPEPIARMMPSKE